MAKFLGLDYITPIKIASEERVSITETLSLKRQSISNDTHRWALGITLAPSNNKGGTAADAHGAKLSVHKTLNGIHKSFTLPMPQHLGLSYSPSNLNDRNAGSATSAGAVDTDSTFGRHGILNLTPNVSGSIPAGWFIGFENHSKVYQVIEEVTLTNGNSVVAKIHPPLVSNISQSTNLITDPDITVFYAQDSDESVTYTSGIMVQASISVVEAL
jgi:hypothetical protein